MAAQVQHGCLKGQTGAGGGLVEQSSQLFVVGNLLIGGGVGADTVGKIKQLCDLLLGEIQRIDQMTHGQYTSV